MIGGKDFPMATATTTTSEQRPRRRLPSVIAGLIAFLVVAGAGSYYVLSRPATYTATASVVVLPAKNVSETAVSGYYETLSRGQIVETYAEVFRLPEWSRAAIDALGVPADVGAKITTSASVVPSTAVIDVTATAPDGATAEDVVAGMVDRTSQYITSLAQPYDVHPISDASGTAKASGIPKIPFLAVVLLVAIVIGVAVQQLVYRLGEARGRSRAVAPVPPQAGATTSEGDAAVAPAIPQPAGSTWPDGSPATGPDARQGHHTRA